MVYLTGDTHIPIDISKLNTTNFPEQKNLTRNDYVIILGDFGLYWHEDKTYQCWRQWLQKKPFTILWIDGNHENHDWIDSMPISTWHGGKVHRDGNIIHLMRGQIFDINGKKFLTMGGAASIDKAYRTEGSSWWPQEVPSMQDIDECYDNLEKVHNKVDYVLTHTCPAHLIDPMFYLEPGENILTEQYLMNQKQVGIMKLAHILIYLTTDFRQMLLSSICKSAISNYRSWPVIMAMAE